MPQRVVRTLAMETRSSSLVVLRVIRWYCTSMTSPQCLAIRRITTFR